MSQVSPSPFAARDQPVGETTSGALLRLSNVGKRFGEYVALDAISLAVQPGEILGIIGRSGAGKTTLIRCLNGLERPDTGTVEIEGVDIARVSESELQPIRRRIEAVRAMGANRATIVWEVLVPEALPGLSAGFTVTLISLIGESAVAGAVGAGGLGDLAIRYGYQRFETTVMIAVVLVLIAFVCTVQAGGDRVTQQIDHRAK